MGHHSTQLGRGMKSDQGGDAVQQNQLTERSGSATQRNNQNSDRNNKNPSIEIDEYHSIEELPNES